MKSILALLLLAFTLTVVEAIAQGNLKPPIPARKPDMNDQNLVKTNTTGKEMKSQNVSPEDCPPEICFKNAHHRSGISSEQLIEDQAPPKDGSAQPGKPAKAIGP